MDLADKKCVPCKGSEKPLNKADAGTLLKQLKDWTLSGDVRWISKEFKFQNFADALAFADKVGGVAEGEDHHPDLQVSWGKTVVELTTHAIDGLSENDFIVAAKIDRMQTS